VSLGKLYYVICDQCGDHSAELDTSMATRKWALSQGWQRLKNPVPFYGRWTGLKPSLSLDDHLDLCPECVREVTK